MNTAGKDSAASAYPLVEQPECKHTPSPEGYIQFHAWAEKKSKTHRQIRCPVCGLWAIWVPKKGRVAA